MVLNAATVRSGVVISSPEVSGGGIIASSFPSTVSVLSPFGMLSFPAPNSVGTIPMAITHGCCRLHLGRRVGDAPKGIA